MKYVFVAVGFEARFGTPNNRLRDVMKYMPICRRLGLIHHLMTTSPNMSMEQVQMALNAKEIDWIEEHNSLIRD